jgi:23S rRNA A1618 N6-methylase RlmF
MNKLGELICMVQIIRLTNSGTGACCVYPLLGARLCKWSFLATDIDPISLDLAAQNVARNNMQEKIELRQSTEDVILKVIKPNEK